VLLVTAVTYCPHMGFVYLRRCISFYCFCNCCFCYCYCCLYSYDRLGCADFSIFLYCWGNIVSVLCCVFHSYVWLFFDSCVFLLKFLVPTADICSCYCVAVLFILMHTGTYLCSYDDSMVNQKYFYTPITHWSQCVKNHTYMPKSTDYLFTVVYRYPSR